MQNRATIQESGPDDKQGENNMDNVPFKNWEYNRPNQQQNRIYILCMIDHKNKWFNIRAEHDPRGKDSLGAYYMASLKVMKNLSKNANYDYDWHHVNVNRYLVENIDTVDQTIVSVHACDTTDQKSRQAGRIDLRPAMRALRAVWKDQSYTDMNKYNPGKTAGTITVTEDEETDTDRQYMYEA